MWIPKGLKLVNILSHQNTEHQFQNNQTTLIMGVNADDEGQESNGSGKSALIEGFYIGATGSSFRKMTGVELIRDGEEKGIVELHLFNTLASKELHIVRTFYRAKGKASTVQVYIDGVHKADLTSVREADKFILEELGISKEDLTNYFIISKEKYESFLYSSDTAKKEIISRFSNADKIDDVDELVKRDLQEAVQALNNLSREITAGKAKLQVYEEQLLDTKNDMDFQAEIESKVEQLEEQKSGAATRFYEGNLNLKKAEEKLADLESELDNYEPFDFRVELADVNEAIKTCNARKQIKRNNKLTYENQKATFELALAGKVVCPKCEHGFLPSDAQLDLADVREKMPEVIAKITEFEVGMAKLDKMLESLETQKSGIAERQREQETILYRKQKAITDQKAVIQDINRHRLTSQQQYKDFEAQIARLKAFKPSTDTNTLQEKINATTGLLEALNDQVLGWEDKKMEAEEWLGNFKAFKTYLANQSIKSIEGYTNMFLEGIKSNLQVEITGFKELASGKAKEQIDVTVIRNGATRRSFGALSSGEKVRVDVCTILAMQALINQSSPSGGLNLFIADEIIESLDASGLREILKSLNNLKNKTIWVVTHGNLEMAFENKLVVTKKNGISTINGN